MAQIQSNIGLISGIPIMDTVDKLMAASARPQALLGQRTALLQQEEIAVTTLAGQLWSVKYSVDKLGESSLFDQKQVTSSAPTVLGATVTGEPPKGTYSFTPLRTVQSQQLLSSGLTSDTASLGGGSMTFRFGSHVQRSTPLDLIGGGEGIARGSIRITDRSGASAEIDLSTARSIDDVLEAINSQTTIRVTAAASGDGLRLTDTTGQTTGNLKVEEVGSGTTAASLGLAGIDVAADSADGDDMIRLFEGLSLDSLNDGNGVLRDRVLSDLEYTLRDGTTGKIDLSPIASGSSEVNAETTLGEMLDVLNAADPEKLQFAIGPDGDRLQVTDLTTGEGTFSLTSLNESQALADLGLDAAAVDGQITGRRILAGTNTVLLSRLNGGEGVGELGALALTDRSGTSANVDLSGAETLEDVIDAINDVGIGIRAQVNAARNGIELVDTTGLTSGTLVVANGDATNTADALGIAVNDTVGSVGSGDMHLQVVAQNTRLASLGGGAGVAKGTLYIHDSAGRRATLDLTGDNYETIGNVIRQINHLNVDVHAELNATGDGIRLRDTAGGNGTLRVEAGTGTTAADLHLLGTAEEVDLDGQLTQVIDGSMTYTIELGENDSLADLRDKIDELGAGVTAMILNDGSSKPYRLVLASEREGRAGSMVVDVSQLGLTMEETVAAQDALLALGTGSGASSVLLTSSSNTFNDVLPGVALEVKQASETPVTVTVGSTNTNLIATVKSMVDNYNKFRKGLTDLTAYNAETETPSVLTGDATAIRMDSDLSYLLSGRIAGAGKLRSLAEVGVNLNKDGTLTLDEAKLKAQFAADPRAVEDLFTSEDTGFVDKFSKMLESLAGEDRSLLSQRIEVLQKRITDNQDRLEDMQQRLEAQRERMLLHFYQMETAIAKMQSAMSGLDSIQPISMMSSTRKSS